MPVGLFGENVRTTGLDVTVDACATGLEVAAAQGLLDSGVWVLPAIRAKARRVVDPAQREASR